MLSSSRPLSEAEILKAFDDAEGVDIKDIKEAFSIRGKVFVEGMNIPVEIELDKYDKVAHQIIAYADEIPAGTARWRKTKEGMKLERFAV